MRFSYFSHIWKKRELTPHQRYEMLWRELQLAEDMQFDYGFCVEHHFSPTESWISSPSIFTAMAAARTKHIKLGAMGYVVPLHNPIRLVEDIALLDQMTNGRVEVGLMPGITETFFKHFNADFANRRAITMEFARFMKAAYAQPSGASFNGERIQAQNLELSVPPVQKPHPPLWMPSGDPKTLAICAELGAHTGNALTFPRAYWRKVYEPYIAAWKQHGHAGRPNVSYSTLVYVDETDEIALNKTRDDLRNAFSYFFSYTGDPEEIRKGQQQFAAFCKHQLNDELTAEIVLNLLDPDYLVQHEMVLIGAPDTVQKRLRMYADEMAVNTLMGEFNFGEMSEPDLHRSIRLFGEHVMPALREYEPF